MASKTGKEDRLQIGLVGLGSIGRYVARALIRGEVEGATLLAVAKRNPPPGELLRELEGCSVSVVYSYHALLEFPIQVVVECASQQVVRECAGLFASRGIDLVIMSVGALADPSFFRDIAAKARENGSRIHVPSGAVGAVDALRAAGVHGLDEVTLTTRKPPRSLGRVEGVDLEGLVEPRVVYQGMATEAVVQFPQNVNVAATISLAGVGPEKTKVRIVADPTIDRNIHEIRARGAFGSFEIRLANNPSPENPKTSYLACMSVVSLLKGMRETVQIGN